MLTLWLCARIQSAWYLRDLSRFIRSPTYYIFQYIKQEERSDGPKGREARATRLITEYASTRIGRAAFDIALDRPRKVCPMCIQSNIASELIYSSILLSYINQMFFLLRTVFSVRVSGPSLLLQKGSTIMLLLRNSLWIALYTGKHLLIMNEQDTCTHLITQDFSVNLSKLHTFIS